MEEKMALKAPKSNSDIANKEIVFVMKKLYPQAKQIIHPRYTMFIKVATKSLRNY